jgi:hypothetical protein
VDGATALVQEFAQDAMDMVVVNIQIGHGGNAGIAAARER